MKNRGNLEYIVLILKSLTHDERRVLEGYFDCFHEDPGVKTRVLIDQLLSKLDELPENQVIDMILRRYSPQVIANLSTRLITSLNEQFILDANIRKKTSYSEASQVYLQVAKRIMTVRALWERAKGEFVK